MRDAPSESGKLLARPGLWQLAAVLGLALASLYPAGNPDTFGHLAAGRQVSELGYVPRVDHFSYSRPERAAWHNYEWLSDLVFYHLHSLVGWSGLVLFKVLLIAFTGWLLVASAARLGGTLGAAASATLLLWALPALRFRLSVRPHIFGFAFGALYLFVLPWLARAAPSRKRLSAILGLAACHAMWVNLHGSHLLGLAITGLWALAHVRDREARRPLLALLSLELLASCASPFGPAILFDALDHVVDPAYRALVREWGPWRFSDPLWIGVALLVQCVLVLAVARGLLRLGARGVASLLVLVVLAVMALRSVRFVGQFLLLSAPLLAGGLLPFLREVPQQRALRDLAILASLSLVAAPLVWSRLPPEVGVGLGVDTRLRPASSVRWLARYKPAARVFSAADDGWFVLYGAPRAKVFFDGRVPFYGVEHVRLMRAAFARPAALHRVLDRSRTDAVLLLHSAVEHQPALRAMLETPDWSLVHVERLHALFVRGERDDALVATAPGYDAMPLLGDRALAQRVLAEVERLGDHPNATAFADWVRAIASLSELAREGGLAGLRPARVAPERARAAAAAATLDRLSREALDLPILDLQAAMAALAACDLEQATASLERAARAGDSRELTLLRDELALRRGEVEGVRAQVERALSRPGLSHDPWLLSLREAVKTPPRCGR